MTPNPDIMRAVERLDYRATVGDVAAQAGLDVNLTQQGLLALASEASGHLQVAESGEIVYLFPKNFRAILRNKYLRLRLQEWWNAIWKVVFYLIRISFGIILLVSIFLIIVTIMIVLVALSANRSEGSNQRGGSGNVYLPNVWFSPDFIWIFHPGYYNRQSALRRSHPERQSSMNFFEAVFSFLFGDGNPNADLEERRWQQLAAVIRNHRGAVAAEQLTPYLDQLGEGYTKEYEEYMLPILSRFDGRPEVSPGGDIIYHFPALQVTANQAGHVPVPAYLKEFPYRFSQAGTGQLLLAMGLGAFNFIGALALGKLLMDGTIAAELGGLVAFVQSIYWVLFGYAAAFLVIPLVRYFWVQWRNQKIAVRNDERQTRAVELNAMGEQLHDKLEYAKQFANQTVIHQDDLVYTTERDLIEQEVERSHQIDAEWERRLNQE